MFWLDYGHAVSNGNLILDHALTGPHAQFKAESGARIGDDFAARAHIVLLELWKAGGEGDCVTAQCQVAGGSAKDGDCLGRSGHRNAKTRSGENDGSTGRDISIAGSDYILVGVASEGDDVTRNDGSGSGSSQSQRGRANGVTCVVGCGGSGGSLRGGNDASGFADVATVEVSEDALTKKRVIASFVHLEQVRCATERDASGRVDDVVTVSERRTVVGEDLLRLSVVIEDRGCASGGAVGAGSTNGSSKAKRSFDFVDVNANALSDLIAHDSTKAGVERERFFRSPVEAGRLVGVDDEGLGADGLVRRGGNSHCRGDRRAGVGGSNRAVNRLTFGDGFGGGIEVDSGNQAGHFAGDDIQRFIGKRDEIGKGIGHGGESVES